MIHCSEKMKNDLGERFEKFAMSRLTCSQCNSRLSSVQKSWIDLQCMMCGMCVEVKSTMKKGNIARLSCGSAYVYEQVKKSNHKHFIIVFQYRVLDYKNDVYKIKVTRSKIFNLHTSDAIQTVFFEHHSKSHIRQRVYLDVDMQSIDSDYVLKNNAEIFM